MAGDISRKLGIIEQESRTIDEEIQDLFLARRAELLRALRTGGYLGTSVESEEVAGELGREAVAQAKVLKQKEEVSNLTRQQAELEKIEEAERKKQKWGNIASIVGTAVGLGLAPFTGGVSIPIATALGGLGKSAIGGDSALVQQKQAMIEQQLSEQEQYLQSILGGLYQTPETTNTEKIEYQLPNTLQDVYKMFSNY